MKMFCVICSIVAMSLQLFAGEFQKVAYNNSNFVFVKEYFHKVIEPLYGDQSQALLKIGAGKDRTCELLYDSSQSPVGMLVYKNSPVEEFACLGAGNALEIKTLFVMDATQNSGRGLGSQLLDRVVSVAQVLRCSCLVVTVSEEKKESLSFFLRKGFFVTHTMHGKFKKGLDEYVLVRFL